MHNLNIRTIKAALHVYPPTALNRQAANPSGGVPGEYAIYCFRNRFITH